MFTKLQELLKVTQKINNIFWTEKSYLSNYSLVFLAYTTTASLTSYFDTTFRGYQWHLVWCWIHDNIHFEFFDLVYVIVLRINQVKDGGERYTKDWSWCYRVKESDLHWYTKRHSCSTEESFIVLLPLFKWQCQYIGYYLIV